MGIDIVGVDSVGVDLMRGHFFCVLLGIHHYSFNLQQSHFQSLPAKEG